jgi:hypothetical protein
MNGIRDAVGGAVRDLEDRLGRMEGPEIPDDVLEMVYGATEALQKALCASLGHRSESDMCGNPDHDYCCWCGVRTPGMAPR